MREPAKQELKNLKIQKVKSIEHLFVIIPEKFKGVDIYDIPGIKHSFNQYITNINRVRNVEYFADIVFFDLVTIDSNEA